jgi:hypothetical protein
VFLAHEAVCMNSTICNISYIHCIYVLAQEAVHIYVLDHEAVLGREVHRRPQGIH